jgi:geranylgeranyl transferase type-2 subunit beta
MFRRVACTLAGLAISKLPASSAALAQPAELANETLAFIRRCARPDGGYDPSPDPAYEGNSDTRLSDLAAVTYAATLARTMGWELPHPERSIDYIQRRQQLDGSFMHLTGKMDLIDHALLYNAVQGVVALRALGGVRKSIRANFWTAFCRRCVRKRPAHATSFFPLFYAALGKPFPGNRRSFCAHQVGNEPKMAILAIISLPRSTWRIISLVDRRTPKAERMVVERVLRDQKPDGGWNIKQPDWDVHACFDAVFILRQWVANQNRSGKRSSRLLTGC